MIAVLLCISLLHKSDKKNLSNNESLYDQSVEIEYQRNKNQSSIFEFEEIQEISNRDSYDSEEDGIMLIPNIVDIPFKRFIIESYESLKQNIFAPISDPNHIEKVKLFHERIEFLESKERNGELSVKEKDELDSLKILKKKDLKEIMTLTYDKHKESLTEEQNKLFLSELEALNNSLQSHSR